jgi:hypothetical protein
MEDFQVDQAEPFGEEQEAEQTGAPLRVLSCPVPLSSAELDAKYRDKITHVTIAEDGALFDEGDGSVVWLGMIGGTDRLVIVSEAPMEEKSHDTTTATDI